MDSNSSRGFESIVLALAIGCTNAASAETGQTPENAASFLQKILPEMPISGAAYREKDGRERGPFNGSVLTYQAEGRCGFTILVEGVRSDPGNEYRMKGRLQGSFETVVAAEKHKDGVIYFRVKAAADGWIYYLNPGSDALADRIVYAMNFLMMECDPAAGTGF